MMAVVMSLSCSRTPRCERRQEAHHGADTGTHLGHAVVLSLHDNGSVRTVSGKVDWGGNGGGLQSASWLHKTICAHVRRFHNVPQSIRNLRRHFFLNLRALTNVVHNAVELGQPDNLCAS